MKILINYADKQYEPARKWNTLTGRYIARFDKVYEYTPNDIDQSFAKLHHDILSQKRGNGLWLWKPYFVNKVLSNCSDGDIIFYCDSGSFFIRGLKNLCSKYCPFYQIQNRIRPLRHVLFQSETGVFSFCPFQTEHVLSALDFPFFPAS